MRFPEDDELTVERLADDLYIYVITTSGKEYKISVNLQRISNYHKDHDLKDYRENIYKWWNYNMDNK